MSLLDEKLIFGKDLALASATTGTNVIDTGLVTSKKGGNRHGAGYFNIHISEDVEGTSSTIKLQDSANESSGYADVVGVSAVVTGANAGKYYSFLLPETKKFLRVSISSTEITGGKATVFIGPAIAEH